MAYNLRFLRFLKCFSVIKTINTTKNHLIIFY